MTVAEVLSEITGFLTDNSLVIYITAGVVVSLVASGVRKFVRAGGR